MELPVVDFSSWYNPQDEGSRQRVAHGLVDACQRVGFVRIINHSIPETILDETFGRKLREVPDVKEVYDIGSENDKGQPNQWLPEPTIPGFRAFITRFYNDCDRIGEDIFRALAVGLNLEDIEYLAGKHSGDSNRLRLLHYLAVPAEDLEEERVMRCAAHSDWSSITLLFQDDCGGLEIIINIGDLLMRWGNDRLRSTTHRVGLPELSDRFEGPARMTRERFSIPYFISPDDDTLIECIPSCISEEEPAKYEPITRWGYHKMRMATMY
ncbi:hypothetical protein BDW69DRAFT_194470 [Aspergillus filifer]